MLRIEDVRERFVEEYKAGRFVNGTVEILGESFIASEETIFGLPNQDYVRRELDWYNSGSLNVNDIPGGAPAIWKAVATPDGQINSNYGFLLFDERNGMQLEQVVGHLLDDLFTRRAVAVYTRPGIHQDWNWHGMSDFICTNAVQYLVRDGRLNVVVQMRSNDAIFGYRNDYAWQRHIQSLVLDDLDTHGVELEAGDIIWNAGSLHIYERHFGLIEQFIETGDPRMEVKNVKVLG